MSGMWSAVKAASMGALLKGEASQQRREKKKGARRTCTTGRAGPGRGEGAIPTVRISSPEWENGRAALLTWVLSRRHAPRASFRDEPARRSLRSESRTIVCAAYSGDARSRSRTGGRASEGRDGERSLEPPVASRRRVEPGRTAPPLLPLKLPLREADRLEFEGWENMSTSESGGLSTSRAKESSCCSVQREPDCSLSF